MEYRAWKFEKLAGSDLGIKLWEFLNEKDSFMIMETATRLKRPVVEGIAEELKRNFYEEISELENSIIFALSK